MRPVPVAVWIFIAIVIALLALALYGYLSGAWENDEPATISEQQGRRINQ